LNDLEHGVGIPVRIVASERSIFLRGRDFLLAGLPLLLGESPKQALTVFCICDSCSKFVRTPSISAFQRIFLIGEFRSACSKSMVDSTTASGIRHASLFLQMKEGT
jgi:hypothetical protein